MKNIDKGSIKHLIVLISAIIIFGIILYPLFDLLICKFITKSTFSYSIYSHIIEPITFGIIMGSLFWILDKRR